MADDDPPGPGGSRRTWLVPLGAAAALIAGAESLSVSWNVNAPLDAAGGFAIRWGTENAVHETGELTVTLSEDQDRGASWAPNIDVGAGLGGDQFRPRAVVDVARNVYVVFQDTTDGARIVASRFDSEGSFAPPLAPSAVAGGMGVVGDNPTVATDRYGTVYVAWEENRDGPSPRVFFNRAE